MSRFWLAVCWSVAFALVVGACTGGDASEPATTTDGTIEGASAGTDPTAEVTGPVATGNAIPSTARCYAVMTDAPGDTGVLLFGGWSEPLSDDGEWQGVSAFSPGGGWTDVADPPHGGGDAFAFDTRSGRAVSLEVGGGTWGFDPVAATWEELLKEAPPAHGSRMVYDSGSDRLVAFGGDEFGPLFDSTWSYDADAGEWIEMAPKQRPQPRSYFAMAYDERSDRVIVFGGWDGSGQLGDTWSYDLDTDTWTRLSKGGGPEPREYSAMAYDRQTDRIILFGGVTGAIEDPLADTWAFDLETNTWTQLEVEGPSARGWHVMAADAETGTIVVFGGGPSREACTDETWIFDPREETWTAVE